MQIPREQNVIHAGGGSKTILLNPEYAFTQVSITGRNTGTITPLARPVLTANELADFNDTEFESVIDGDVDLTGIQKTFTIENKKMTALKMVDGGSGSVTFVINQWGRI